MPEIAIHEHDDPVVAKHKVRFARQIASVQFG